MRRIARYIHERPDWPELRWDAAALTAPLASVRHAQGRLLGRMESLGFEFRTEANVETLTSDVVKSSAIEGEQLDAGEVRSSIARRLGLATAGASKADRDVEGVVEMMLDATQRYSERLTASRLFDWHASLFPSGRTGMRTIEVGRWRSDDGGPMQVVSGPYGRERVHFEAPAAIRVAAEMKRFLTWFEKPTQIDSVLRAALAHFRFVTIHPFEDGNGRIARAIADMALARADGTSQRFYSMSAQIESERRDYYAELERSQRGDTDVTEWLTWFLGCLGRAIEGAERSLEAVLRKARVWKHANSKGVNDRERLVLNRLLDGFFGPLTTSKYAKLAKCSQDTAHRDIRELIERGILQQTPVGGRSTSYRLAESFA